MIPDNNNIVTLLEAHNFSRRYPTPEESINALKAAFNISLPADFEELLRFSNGGSIYGFKTPFIVFSVKETLALYREFDYYTDVPQFMIWGADGGGMQYAYDLRDAGFTVCVFYQDDPGYDKIVYKTSSITAMVKDIVSGKKINDSDPCA